MLSASLLVPKACPPVKVCRMFIPWAGCDRGWLKIFAGKQFALFRVVQAEVLSGPEPPPLTALGDFSKPRPRGYALYGCAEGVKAEKWHFKRAYSRRNMPYNCLQVGSVRPWFESFPGLTSSR